MGFVESSCWISGHCRCLVPSLELDWCKHAQCRMTALAIVEDLEALEDRIGQLDPCTPDAPVEQFDLHPAPERLDEGIVEATPDRAHRGHEARVERAPSERPAGELGALVRAN